MQVVGNLHRKHEELTLPDDSLILDNMVLHALEQADKRLTLFDGQFAS